MVVFDKDLKMLPLLEHSRSIACSAYIWHRANIFEHLPRGNELRIPIVIFFLSFFAWCVLVLRWICHLILMMGETLQYAHIRKKLCFISCVTHNIMFCIVKICCISFHPIILFTTLTIYVPIRKHFWSMYEIVVLNESKSCNKRRYARQCKKNAR